VIVIGFSMGGALAATLAAECSPKGLILCAPFWKFDTLLWRLLPVLKYLFPRIKPFRLFRPNFADPETRQGILKFMPGINLDDPAVQTAILNFEIPIRMIDSIRLAGQQAQHSMAQIHCPTLVIQGIADDLVQPSLTRQLIMALPTAATYIEVDANHALLNPEQPHWQIVTAQVKGFIQAQSLGGNFVD
jgi:esterase/lipase